MALLNLNTLLADHTVPAEGFMRARVELADTDNFTHIFSDTHLTLTRPNPVEADANGIFELCYLMDGAYRVHLFTASDKALSSFDIRLTAAPGGNSYRHRFESLPQLAGDTSLSYGEDKGRVQVAPGDYVKSNDSGVSYRVAAADAANAPIATQGGVRLYINRNKYDITAEAWGVKMTGADADAAQNAVRMQAAIDWLSSEGGGRLTLAGEGHMKIDHPIALRPGVIVDGAGTLTDNILTRQGAPADKFDQSSTYLTGGFAKTDHDDHSWYKLDEVLRGADVVTLSTPAEAVHFQPGDIVWIVEANETWGDGQHAQPARSELARVLSASNGVLQMEFHNSLPTDIAPGAGTIAVNPTGAWIANVDWRMAAGKTGGDWVDTRFVLKDAALVNHRLIQSGQDGTRNTALFGTRSGVYNCRVENIEGMGMVANLMFGNGYAHSRYHNIRGPYMRRAIELKYLSQSSIFSDLEMWKMNHGFADGFDEDTPISIGEGSRSVIIDQPRIDVGQWKGDGSGLNLINFTGACDCEVRGAHITGKAAFGSAVAFPSATRCGVDGGRIMAPTSVTIEDNGTDCHVRDMMFVGPVSTLGYRRSGTARGGRITGNTWCHEATARTFALEGDDDRAVVIANNTGLLGIDNSAGRHILARENLNAGWAAILSAGAGDNDLLGENVTSTTEGLLGHSVTLPAGTLAPGDIFKWKAAGEYFGSNGPCTLSWRAAVDTDDDGVALDADDDVNQASPLDLPPSCADWVVHAKALVTHSNRIVTHFEVIDLTAGTTIGTIRRHVSADFATHPTILALSCHVSDAADTLTVRSIEREARRPGYIA